jgi:hypothetical protein
MIKKTSLLTIALLFIIFLTAARLASPVQAADKPCFTTVASSKKLCTDWFGGEPASCVPSNTKSTLNGLEGGEDGICVLDSQNKINEENITLPQQGFSFDNFNPLNPAVNGTTDKNAPTFKTPADVINRFVRLYAFPAAGLILFVMVVWGGFEMVAGATNTKAQDAGKQRITAAIIGFVILFAAYWLVQIIQAVFGVKIF